MTRKEAGPGAVSTTIGCARKNTSRRANIRRRVVFSIVALGALAFLVTAPAIWLSEKARIVRHELEAATQLIPEIKTNVANDNWQQANAAAGQLRSHTAKAHQAVEDPLWTLASAVPVIGANFSAVTEVSRSADDIATLAIVPVMDVFASVNWDSLLPSDSGANLAPVQNASPKLSSAAHAVRVSHARLDGIDASNLLPQVAEPLKAAREQLQSVTGALDAAASAAQIAPKMLGADGPRSYLLMIQNNAESRASGGIPGALAVLTLDRGKLTLGTQSSASDVGTFVPALPVDAEQQQIYSARLGKYMQDVNLTPDFPTAASTAQAMWEKKTGQRVSGVISIDPIALSYILDATGAVQIQDPRLVKLAQGRLPTELNAQNVVPTLLSDVYAKIEEPNLQDAYFAGVAQDIFSALSTGRGEAKGLIQGITRGTQENRILVWSESASEQSVFAQYPLGGSIVGPSVSPAQFGVYFNDGTGAKMDYYVKRTVQLVEECATSDYRQVKVRVTSTNTAPLDAGSVLPDYVTGGGSFGVPEGTVQSNIIVYGPVQANVDSATLNGKKSDFAAHRHSNRPVGSVTVTLAPGQSSTVELTFGKIVQHAEPNLVVTPTVQAVKDVILASEPVHCEAG